MDRLTKEKRSWNMSRIRSKNTKPEKRLRSLLHRVGYRFRINVKRLPGSPDIALPKYRTIIFVHGCFWHRHTGCKYAYTPKSRIEFWENKFRNTIERDQKKANALEASGWQVLVVWECELKNNPQVVLMSIIEKLKEVRNGS
jgi:DNA mismatch endonuclease (patch repair protein)